MVYTMGKKFILTAGVFISIFILLYSLYAWSPPNVLMIEEVKTGEILWQQPIEKEEWFRHEYVHSVEKSKVIEKFKFSSDGEMLAMESWTRSFGAGMPYEQRGTVEFIDGYYVLSDLNDPIEVLHMIPSHLQLHTFHFNEEEIVLSEPPFKRNHIKIEVVQLSIIERISYIFSR